MLKRFHLFFGIIIVVFCSFPLSVYPGLQASDTVLSYFKALKLGDIRSLKIYTSQDFYETNKILLEQNSYQNFLKKFYTGTVAEVVDIKHIADDEVVVKVEVFFPNQSTSFHKFSLKKYNDIWKIDRELHD